MKTILLFILFVLKFSGISSLSSINTIPPSPSNELATGYTGLIVNVQFEKGSKTFCGWRFFDKINSLELFSPLFPCGPRNTASESSSCVEEIINGVNHITSNLTFNQPLSSGILGVFVYCEDTSSKVNFTLPTKTIQDCPQTLSNNVIVDSSSNIFNANGRFSCSNNGKLFYSNGNQLQSIETTCLASAKWSGQDNLQCWTAPVVTMTNSFNVNQGNDLTLTCQYNDGFPTGPSSVFYIDGIGIVKPKGQPHTLTSLQPTDNNKVVSCQAVTPYTQIFNDTGRSPQYTINVQYAPYQANPTTCYWVVTQTGICNVTFYSNPQSFFKALKSRDTNVTNQGSNIINGTNGMHIFSFKREKVTISDNGNYNLILRSSLPPYNHSINFVVVTLTATTTTQPSSTSTPATSTSTGLYIGIGCACFAIFILMVVLVLIVKRKRNNKKKGDGSIQNPAFDGEAGHTTTTKDVYATVMKKKKPNESSKQSKQPKVEDAYAQVDMKKKKKNKDQLEQKEDAYAIVDRKKKKKAHSGKEEKINPLYVSSEQQGQIESAYAEVDLNNEIQKNDQKEERINPLYAPQTSPDIIEDAYAEVDRKKKKKTKKPVGADTEAGASTSIVVENAYAEVDRKKKKNSRSVKPVGGDIQSGASASRDHVEDAYAEVDLKKKRKKKPSSAATSAAPVEDAYAEVDLKKKKKKKPSSAATDAGPMEDAYAEVDLKKKKKKKSSSATTASGPIEDAYAEVDLKKKKKNNPSSATTTLGIKHEKVLPDTTYAEVKKPKKNKKLPSHRKYDDNTGGFVDVDLHGTSQNDENQPGPSTPRPKK